MKNEFESQSTYLFGVSYVQYLIHSFFLVSYIKNNNNNSHHTNVYVQPHQTIPIILSNIEDIHNTQHIQSLYNHI